MKAVIEKDSLSLLKTETDSAKLFRAFQQQYDHHDAETVFP